MYIIVGLGNPGTQYSNTHHNAGFMAVEKLADPNKDWKSEHKALTMKVNIAGEECLLAKPQTYMNLSGEAVQAMFRHASALLAAAGCGAGNRPFRAWPDVLNDKLPKSYVQRYAACVKLFEEAAYSDHPTDEAARARVRELLDETERLVLSRADWKEKLRLRYVECLCE